MVVAGTRVALTAVALFAWFAAGQRITTIQLDGTQYYISRMNPYSAELNYFLAYEYCRSIGLQLASFETLEKTNSISDFLRNAGYNKFDYWTSGNRLGTDMLIWMSTGLPFNTTFNQMKRPSPDGNNLDNEELKMSVRPELPIARKKRGESGSRDGCVAIKAPNMDWTTADCTDLKDFICEQTRCYYYNYGSIPVSSSQGFGYKQKQPPAAAALYSTTAVPPQAENATALITPTVKPPTAINNNYAPTTAAPSAIVSSVFSTTAAPPTTTTVTTTTAEDAEEEDGRDAANWTAATTLADSTATEPQTFQQESLRTDQQQPTAADDQQSDYYTTSESPSLIQMHNRQQHEQQLFDRQRHAQQSHDRQRNDQREKDQEHEDHEHNSAYAFESLEKAFATAVPHKIRATKDLEQPKDTAGGEPPLPWSWAKDIMLQKPVLRKTSQEAV